jgi:hypothetical protein
MRILATLLVLLGLAQAAIPDCPAEPRRPFLFPCAMTRYSTPLKLGWVLGVAMNQPVGRYGHHGPFVQLEPGFGGGKVNLGYRYGQMSFLPIFNVGLAGSLLRTWGNPLGDVEPGQTYVGLELSGAFSALGLNAGIFRHVAGDDENHQWITVLGVGAGI